MAGTKSTDRFRRVFDLLDQGVVVLDDGRILQVNPAWANLVNMDPQDAEGQSLVEFIAPDARDDLLGRIAKGDEGPYASLLMTARGDPVPVRVRHHEFAEEGRHMHILVVRDMRQELERMEGSGASSANEELERLRATDQFKTHLLNTAAHELNTPITPLRLQTHLLKSGSLGEMTEKQRRAIAILDRNVQRLSLLVKDVLDVARMEAGNLKIDAQAVDVDSLLQDVFDSFQDTAEQVRIRLERTGQHGLAVDADPDRLVQVLYNLTSNALKFTPADGIIRADVSRTDDGRVRIDVQDTGIGLTPEQINMLFKPFSQAHDPKDFSATGTGLGLYISRGIVEAHGGTIECTSEGNGRGSTFTVTLPRSEADPSTWVTATGSQPPKAEIKRQDAMLERLRELI